MRAPRPIGPMRPPDWLVQGAAEVGGVSVALLRSGVWRPARPSQLIAIERALHRWGQSMAALGVIAAIRYPDRPAVIDDQGSTTYAELDRRCERIAAALHANHAIVAGSKVAVLCRNHRGFLEATLSASRVGADVLFLNTEFAPSQIKAVLERERPDLLVRDAEFAADADIPEVLSEDLFAASDAPEPPWPEASQVTE